MEKKDVYVGMEFINSSNNRCKIDRITKHEIDVIRFPNNTNSRQHEYSLKYKEDFDFIKKWKPLTPTTPKENSYPIFN